MIYTKTDEIFVEAAPRINGLGFRHFYGEEDYPGMLEVFKSAMTADGIEVSETLEEIASNYQHLERCDPYTDMLFAEIDGDLVAYGRCWWDAEPNNDHRYSFFINLLPEWRGKGLGKAMAGYLIDRLRTISEDHPQQAAKHLQGWATDKQKWQQNLLESLGLETIRYGYMMVRPCSQPLELHQLPEGIEVRPVSPSQFRQIWDAQAEAFRDHWGYVEPTEKNYQSWLEFPHSEPELWKVAWDGDQVIGMVLNFINYDENQEYNRQRGYTEDISVRRPWRRQGVARALLAQSIQMFQQMGMEETVLGVDAENPNGALNLYESLGYTPYRTSMTYRKPLHES
jgi:ribosomal protein S18 acetylase RimI-like enzyme